MALYHFIDGQREAFSLRVDGDFPGTQEFWYAHRELDLRGSAFNAEGMTISDAKQGGGYGRALMGDLIDAGKLIGIERIKLRAERIGRYVWLKMGFLPSDDSCGRCARMPWNLSLNISPTWSRPLTLGS